MKKFLIAVAVVLALGMTAGQAVAADAATTEEVTTTTMGRSTPDVDSFEMGYGGITLNLPAGGWNDVVWNAEGESAGVASLIKVLARDAEEATSDADIGVVSQPNDKARLGELKQWMETIQLPEFLEFYRQGAPLTVLSKKSFSVEIGGIKGVRFDLKVRNVAGEANISTFGFTKPDGTYRYALFVYNVGEYADVGPILLAAATNVVWR